MAAWQYVMQNRSGEPLANPPRWQNRRVSFLLNRPCEASASLSLNSAAAVRNYIRPGVSELQILRDGTAQETAFSCTGVRVVCDENAQRMEVQWRGIMSYLQDGVVLGRKSAYSGSTLPWTWINAFQARTNASVFGLTLGGQSGAPASRSRRIEQDGSVLDEIIHLSETSTGFDFNVDASRRYNEWHPQRGRDLGLVLEYGVNVVSFEYEEACGAGDVVTDARVYGPPGTRRYTATDATASAIYGRREASLTYFSEMENATVTSSQLQAFATAAVTQRAYPNITPVLVLRRDHPTAKWGSYWLGDTVNFRASVGSYTTLALQYRIVGIHVDLDENDNETVSLELNKA